METEAFKIKAQVSQSTVDQVRIDLLVFVTVYVTTDTALTSQIIVLKE
ncbi:hypothetical protein [cf. Phormidesmis sp. LEGE 11477]|nr:hypothetical protein [cf. Phormidesmis sp. LEGE 11477]MBE9062550.1 hypothetical protein [cf. Phormidesmis sp. LEGE 11477]